MHPRAPQKDLWVNGSNDNTALQINRYERTICESVEICGSADLEVNGYSERGLGPGMIIGVSTV